MNSIIIGSFSIPIIYEKEVEHPINNTDYHSLNSSEIFSQSAIDASYAYNNSRSYHFSRVAGSSSSGSASSEWYLQPGTIDFHNGASFVLNAAAQSGGASFPVPQYKQGGSFMLNNTVKYSASSVVSSNGIPNYPGSNKVIEREYHVGVARIKYRDGSRNSYQFITTYMIREYGPNSYSESVSVLGYQFCFNMNTYHVRDNVDAYIEENIQPDPDEPPFDPSDPGDYNPTIDDTSDTITIPGNPLIGVSNAGWVHVYNPSAGGLQNFGAWLFPNPELPSGADPTEIVNYLLLLCQTLANSRLIDYVLDCHIIPVTPQTGTAQDIKVGGRTAVGIAASVVTNDYIDATCGSLNIREYFGGFQDFLCTKSKLYLPFVGFVDVLPEYWQSGTILVDYKFNVIDGSFMCYVRSSSNRSQLTNSIIAQYSGNACVHVPITGVNYANMVSGLVGAAASIEGAKTTSAVLGSAYSAANTILNGGDMIQSNGYTSAASMMGVRYPYLLIERAVPSYAGNYAHDKGYPSNISTLLSNVSGFTVIDDIDLSGIPLMEVELNELRTLLKEGVYF